MTTTHREHRSRPSARPAARPISAPASDLGADPASEFEPIGVEARYPPPAATIHPDTSLGWFRRMAPMLLAHRSLVVISVIAAVIGMGVNTAVPAVLRAGIDNALINGDGSLTKWAVIIAVLAVLRGIMVATYRGGLMRLGHLIDADLRSVVFNHLTRMSFGFFDRTQAGQVISRANSDVRSVAMLMQFGPIVLISCLSFVAAFAYMLTIHVPLALVAVTPLPLVYILGVKMRSKMFPLSWINQSRLGDISAVVDENINGVRVVKSFAAEERQLNELAQRAQRLRWSATQTINYRALYAPPMENLPRLGIMAVLGYGGWLAINDEVTIGTLVAFNAYVILLQAPFRMLGFFLMTVQRAAASAQRIFEVLDEAPEIVDAPDAIDLRDPSGRVVFDKVSFAYATGNGSDDEAEGVDSVDTVDTADSPERVLADFSLTVEAGETVAIVGRTGCGKSTVARLLARFYDVDSGHISIDGHNVDQLTVASLRHHVGIVLDEPFLFSASVANNIAFARPDASRDEIVAAAKAAQAHAFISELTDGTNTGYDTVVGERGYTLSGGQRQRIAIARTLLANPAVLVLDDATSAIDVQVEAEIHSALHALTQTRTTIVIAHRLSTIGLADRVVLLADGEIAATGTHRELLDTEPRYAAVLATIEGSAEAGIGSDAGLNSVSENPVSESKAVG